MIRIVRSPLTYCRAVVAIQKGKLVNTPNEEALKQRTQDGPYLFRSYRPDILDTFDSKKPPLNYGVDIAHEIWKVCRATTAAPFYFESQMIGDDEFCDGGAGVNNPTWEALEEMEKLHRNGVEIIASLGTGKPAPASMFRGRNASRLHIPSAIERLQGMLNTAKSSLTDCEKTHERVEQAHEDRTGERAFSYYRLNIEDGLGKVKLNEWKLQRENGEGGKCTTLEYLRKCTERELLKGEVKAQLLELAKQLVRLRRSRARDDPDRWKRFATCVSYKCDDKTCLAGEKHTFSFQREMEHHLRTIHPRAPPEQWTSEELEKKATSSCSFPLVPSGPY